MMMMMNDELEGMWKNNTAVGYFKVLSTHTHTVAQEKEENVIMKEEEEKELGRKDTRKRKREVKLKRKE
jgi:hypothetical protein